MEFFAYGSLIFGEVMTAVTGRRFASSEATLDGFANYRVADASYLGLIVLKGGSVLGRLYREVDRRSVRMLDRFEGDNYERVSVEVTTQEGERVSAAQTYVFKDRFRHLLTDDPWDVEDFRVNHLSRFLDASQGLRWLEADESAE